MIVFPLLWTEFSLSIGPLSVPRHIPPSPPDMNISYEYIPSLQFFSAFPPPPLPRFKSLFNPKLKSRFPRPLQHSYGRNPLSRISFSFYPFFFVPDYTPYREMTASWFCVPGPRFLTLMVFLPHFCYLTPFLEGSWRVLYMKNGLRHFRPFP